jgi:hypothetical protein
MDDGKTRGIGGHDAHTPGLKWVRDMSYNKVKVASVV